MKKAVTYYQVSTERQGESGLGLDVQKNAVHILPVPTNMTLRRIHRDRIGKKNARPLLLEALEYCRREKAMLLIAKLDRRCIYKLYDCKLSIRHSVSEYLAHHELY